MSSTKNSGPMMRGAAHGGPGPDVDPLVEAKKMADEAHKQLHALEAEATKAAGELGKEVEAEANGWADLVWGGWTTLRQKVADTWSGMATTSNNPPPGIGEAGYGDAASKLEQDMKAAMEGAAKAVEAGKAKATAVLERDPPHVHAPELLHPEQVTSMAEINNAKKASSATDNKRMKMEKAREAVNNLKEEVREGLGKARDAVSSAATRVGGNSGKAMGGGGGGGNEESTARDLLMQWEG